jgi:SRSO17 transposase
MAWVTGDEVYGDSPRVRETIQSSGRWYVLAVSSPTPIWRERPPVEEPSRSPLGRTRTKARLASDAPPPSTVAAVVAAWPEAQWEQFSVAEGEKGPRFYDWGRERVIESRDQLPGPEVWLLARRSLSDPRRVPPSEIAYYLAWAPLETTLHTLARIAATRYTVEQCIEEAKGEAGFDQYEVRFWPSWHRHITLAMMAHAWLASLQQEETKKGGSQSKLSLV